MIIEAVYGTLYVLHVQSPELFSRPLQLWLSGILAILHGAAFSVLAYCVSIFVFHDAGTAGAQAMPAQSQQQGEDTRALLGMCQDMLIELSTIHRTLPATMPIDTVVLPAQEPKMFPCPGCGSPLPQAEYGAAKRWNKCYHCRDR